MIVSSIKYYTGKGISHRHFHDSHQLLFITDGQGSIKINDALHTIRKGNLVILGRFEKHSVTPESSNFKRYALRISTLSQGSQTLYCVFSNRPKGFRNIFDLSENADEIENIFKALQSEEKEMSAMYENMQKLLIDRLLILLYRKYPEVFLHTNDENFEKISDLQRRFEEGFSKQYSLESIAQEYNMSVSYLSHCFKKITGYSVMGYLLKCRLTAAKRMLTHSKSTVTEIVEKCGFTDSSNFSRTFKENTGLTPSQFRKKYSV